MIKTKGYAAESAESALAPWTFERRDLKPADVQIEILFCGICHSDLHQVRSEWAGTVYPCLPGHEIIGRVVKVGSSVTKYKSGDMVGVGCMVDSCRQCASCKEGLEQYCEKGMTLTYNSPDPHTGKVTYGGYSDTIVVDEAFVLRLPKGMDPAAAAPLLCAGITTYSPLKHWNVGKGSNVGIVGLGGLGHMGLKLSHAMGARTTLFTTSPNKAGDAKRLGADEVIVSKDPAAMAKVAGKFEFIINTVAASHNLDPFIAALKRDGTMCLVGAPEHPHPSPQIFPLIMGRKSLAGSAIGGIKETQEMLDFCAQHGVASDIEIIKIQDVNQAYERLVKSDVKYRFVIDMASLRGA